ncbi:MAG TPA: S53 family peptidase [Acidobacteriaceae bacterium]|jgi:kumamolisin
MATPYFATQRRVPLPGSDRTPFSDASAPQTLLSHSVAANGDHTTGDTITVSVIVRRKSALTDPNHRMSREEFEDKHGADPASLAAVRAFAAEFHLKVEKQPHTDDHYRTLHLTGSHEEMEKAFGVTLTNLETGDGALRVRQGPLYLPEELAGHVVAVLGLDNRPQAKPHSRTAVPHAGSVSYTPVQVAALYGFPAGAKATGQTIAILELGGGYRAADLTAYFKTLNLPAPTVTTVSVDKGANKPGNANGADGEVMLDIEVCAAVAPGAKIVVYFAPNTDQGFIDAISTAIHDTTNKPQILSISWGGPESTWTTQSLNALDAACQSAAALGVTITVAAGDDGSTDGVTGKTNHVDFPASSPHVLACGGTKLSGSGSAITGEVVWNELSSNEGATGGGVSAFFALPTWQSDAKVPKPTGTTGGRGVPDVAGDADPNSGYTIRVDGQTSTIGGTSAVAPLWAGLIALANAQNKNSAGFINPAIYATAGKAAFRDITSGNNGGFTAAAGWDACTGLGSPNGAKIIQLLATPAAKPTTPVKKKPTTK